MKIKTKWLNLFSFKVQEECKVNGSTQQIPKIEYEKSMDTK